MASRLTDFVVRPGLGRVGREIRVRANFFQVTELPTEAIHHYDITITPDVPPVLNRKVFKVFEGANYYSALGGTRPVYDGRKNMFTSKSLPLGDAATFDVTLPEEDGTPSKRAPRAFRVKLKKAGEISMRDLHFFLNARGSLTPACLTGIMALDVLIRHLPSMKYTTVGRSFYTPQGSQPLFGGSEVRQGYYQSARPTPGRMMINIDLSATAFYEGGPLLQMFVKLLSLRNYDDLRRGLTDRDRIKIEKAIKNLKIRVTHRGDVTSRRQFKVFKLTDSPAINTKFTTNEGQIDVFTYFKRVYGKALEFPHLPCVVVRKDVYLPVEVCEVVEGQRHIRKLNDKQTADMIMFTCQPPHLRANKIKQGVEILNYRDNEYLQNFHMKISNEMVSIPARILPPPSINNNPSSREAVFKPREGVWNLRDKKLATGAILLSWVIVAFGSEHAFPMQAIQAFVREFVITAIEIGLNIPNKAPPILHANPQGNIDAILKQAWLRAGTAANAQPQLIICVLPNTGEQLYAEIKRVSDTVIGIATQCIQARHMMQAKKQYCGNVGLKMNVKLGGMNWFLGSNDIPFISDRPTIVMGADVTHSNPNNPASPSIATLCATMDAKASRYAASIRCQTAKSDIISDLADMVRELLKNFYQTCGRKPERILFYRDGVSEGQFAQIMEGEIKAIKVACQSLDITYRPTITFVIVQKRHHTRFFPIIGKDADRTGNCLPGTVVETMIIHPFEFDFYLQSHAGLQGTSRPTHYHVLWDENEFDPDSLQTLTYYLTYTFARCTRAVSLVTPVGYAHLLCRRARYYTQHSSSSEAASFSSEEEPTFSGTFGTVMPDLAKVMWFM